MKVWPKEKILQLRKTFLKTKKTRKSYIDQIQKHENHSMTIYGKHDSHSNAKKRFFHLWQIVSIFGNIV